MAPAVALCGTSVSQSPINVPSSLVTYNSTLLPLNVSYGKTASWTLEVTGACNRLKPRASAARCAADCPWAR